MTLHIQFSPETEAKLKQQAKAIGKDVEQIVREVVETKFSTGQGASQSIADRTAQWRSWVEGMTRLAARNLPPGHFVDDSRESIYAGRGE